MGARRRKEYRVKVGDVELSYLVDGHPSAPPLVLLHALSMNARDWSRVSLLLGQQFRVYSLNFRGHGGSGWAPTYAFKDLALEVVGFLDALGIDRAAVVGHALGGIVATFVAAMFPNRVSALVVEEGPPPRIGGPRMAFGEMGLPGVAYDRLALLQVADQMNHRTILLRLPPPETPPSAACRRRAWTSPSSSCSSCSMASSRCRRWH